MIEHLELSEFSHQGQRPSPSAGKEQVDVVGGQTLSHRCDCAVVSVAELA